MSVTLRTYAHLEDAWAGGVEAWCRESTQRALSSGIRSWLVCATRGQGEWIKSRLLRAGEPLLGLSFLTASSLRRELCLRQGLPLPSGEREVLSLVARTFAAMEPGDRRCVTISRQPDDWLLALEELDAAGWLNAPDEFTRFVPDSFREMIYKIRENAPEWLAGVDRRLRDLAPPEREDGLHICFMGWDASNSGRADLLVAGLKNALSAVLYSPLPRSGNESIQQTWLEWLEEEFTTISEPCEGQYRPAHAALVDRLESSDLDNQTCSPPFLLIGASWMDQVERITRYVAEWLVETGRRKTDRMAIVLPMRNESSVALGRRLAELGIAHENTIGERPEPGWAIRLLRSVVAFHREGSTAAALLNLLAVRAEQIADDWLQRAQRHFPDEFERLQSSVALHLARGSWFEKVVEGLGDWQLPAGLDERRNQISRAFDALRARSAAAEIEQIFESIWPILERYFQSQHTIDGEVWLDFLNRSLESIPTARAGGAANSRYAKIVLTTLAEAAGQIWQAVIVADANDEIWPRTKPENPFLPDAVRAALNAKRAPHYPPLLLHAERAALEDVQFLTLLENCNGALAFAASGAVAAKPERTAHPNEWLLRCLIETTPDAGKAWRTAIRQTTRVEPDLDSPAQRHLIAVHESRKNENHRFDEYFLAFGALPESGEKLKSFAARGLESLTRSPAQFAYEVIFDCFSQRESIDAFRREQKKIIGTLAHRWMQTLLRLDKSEFRPLDLAILQRAVDSDLAELRKVNERELATAFPELGERAPGAWWESVLAQAERAVRRWLRALLVWPESKEAWSAVAEHDLAGIVHSQSREFSLSVNGRADLCLAGKSASSILDFKSGDRHEPIKRSDVGVDGNHIPLVAYLWLAQANSLPHPRVGLVTAGGPVQDDLANESDGLRFDDLLCRFGRQQRDLIFGQRGPVVAGEDGQFESLPMATVPIAISILEGKARATGLELSDLAQTNDADD